MTQARAPERIGHLLSKACDLKRRRMHELLVGLGLYRGQPFMLRALWTQDGMMHSELAKLLTKSPTTITKTVQRMEKAGFVERRPDPKDERISRVHLTDAGHNTRAAVEDVWRSFEEQAFAGFSEQELALLRGLLVRICRNMGDSFNQVSQTKGRSVLA